MDAAVDPQTEKRGYGPNKVSMPWHYALADFLVLNPDLPLREVARNFGKTAAWLSQVIHTDAFQDLWARRRNEHFARASATVTQKVEVMTDLAVDGIINQLETLGDNMSLKDLTEVAQLGLKTQGAVAAPAVANTVNVLVGDAAALERAREKLRRDREEVFDVKAEEARPDATTTPALPNYQEGESPLPSS